MQISTVNNTAEFLLDGDEFFEHLHISMRNLLNAATAVDNYLRLAYWGFNRMTVLPACTDGAGTAHLATPIKDLINALAVKGHIVQIIMWYGHPITMSMDKNWAARAAFINMNEAATLDQAALRKVYAARQVQDGDFIVNLNNVLYACQMLYAQTKYANLTKNTHTG